MELIGKTWDEWYAILDAAGSREKPHSEIARWLWYDGGLAENGRLCQGITVTYERWIGRREIGQSCDGDYRTSASRTFPSGTITTIDSALETLLGVVKDRSEFNDVWFANEPAVSATEKWRYWKVNLADGGQMTALFWQQPNGRIQMTVQNGKLPDKATADHWKAYWKPFLQTVPAA